MGLQGFQSLDKSSLLKVFKIRLANRYLFDIYHILTARTFDGAARNAHEISL